MWLLDERRRDRIYGGWRGIGSVGDRRGRWFIGMRFVWLISVRFGWGIVHLWWNINFLKYTRPSILRHPFTQKKHCHKCKDD